MVSCFFATRPDPANLAPWIISHHIDFIIIVTIVVSVAVTPGQQAHCTFQQQHSGGVVVEWAASSCPIGVFEPRGRAGGRGVTV